MTTSCLIDLRPMSGDYFRTWQPHAIRSFAEDKRRTHGYNPDQALALATDGFQRLLPDGPETPDHHLYTLHAETGDVVGQAWLGLQQDYGIRRAFLYEIEIHESRQGRGYGRAAMQALEAESRSLGAAVLGLHVFNFNERARRLYHSLGFQVTDLSMEKPL